MKKFCFLSSPLWHNKIKCIWVRVIKKKKKIWNRICILLNEPLGPCTSACGPHYWVMRKIGLGRGLAVNVISRPKYWAVLKLERFHYYCKTKKEKCSYNYSIFFFFYYLNTSEENVMDFQSILKYLSDWWKE